MEAFRYMFLQRLVNGIEFLSALILLIGFAKGIWGFLLNEIREVRARTEASPDSVSNLRPLVTNYLLLGLDFYLVSSLISTMLHLELNELIRLAVIGGVRTLVMITNNIKATLR